MPLRTSQACNWVKPSWLVWLLASAIRMARVWRSTSDRWRPAGSFHRWVAPELRESRWVVLHSYRRNLHRGREGASPRHT